MVGEAVGNGCFRGLRSTHDGAIGFREAVISEITFGAVHGKPRSLLASRWGVRGLSWRYDVQADTMHRVVVRVLMTRVRKVTLPAASSVIRIWHTGVCFAHISGTQTSWVRRNVLCEIIDWNVDGCLGVRDVRAAKCTLQGSGDPYDPSWEACPVTRPP
ncbi:hypothetical protein WN48_09311 [Eufriesea mexicana]|uniref:Uncharacterized protein n=1 Tax=Eufriesea mexicana TaxID=516756 RepID=A0A310SJG4_9HYME|nr:hypothetical protein WN48_09311 [Eufriesea mexicana]